MTRSTRGNSRNAEQREIEKCRTGWPITGDGCYRYKYITNRVCDRIRIDSKLRKVADTGEELRGETTVGLRTQAGRTPNQSVNDG